MSLRGFVVGIVLVLGCGQKGTVKRAVPAAVLDAGVVESADAAVDESADTDGDGVPDVKDLCPMEPMVMSGGCTPEMMRGCPDDCRPPRF